jgi:hypothetical protein
LAALPGDFEFGPKQSLGGSGSEANDHLGFDQTDFGFEPGTAGSDFASIRLFVNATFAARFPFEMFDYVGDVSLRAIDAGFDQSIVK